MSEVKISVVRRFCIWFFNHQFLKNFSQRYWNEKISRNVQNMRVFLENEIAFFEKNWFFFEIVKSSNFVVESVSKDIISKKRKIVFFSPEGRVFCRDQKNLSSENLSNFALDSFLKKRFHLCKGYLYQNLRAENILVELPAVSFDSFDIWLQLRSQIAMLLLWW